MDQMQRNVVGFEYLAMVTDLLQRARLADRDGGLWEAADFQWAWRRDQHPDPNTACFWVDRHGTPVAAVVFTELSGCVQCDVLAAPTVAGAPWQYALQAIASRAAVPIEVAVRDDDPDAATRLRDSGFVRTAEKYVSCVMQPQDRPAPTALPPGYRLRSRADAADQAHHMIRRNGESVAQRLAECSLYRPELDLFVDGPDGDVVAYGLFWVDGVTGVGLVEPMRTEDDHQGKGLARHVLLTGLDLLATHGCGRLKVTHEGANPAARALYRHAGFEPLYMATTYRRDA